MISLDFVFYNKHTEKDMGHTCSAQWLVTNMEPSLRLRNRTSLAPTPEVPSSPSRPRPAMPQGDPSWLLTARVSFPCLWTSCERNHPACALFCVASFTNIMFLRFIHIVECSCSSFIPPAVKFPIVWIHYSPASQVLKDIWALSRFWTILYMCPGTYVYEIHSQEWSCRVFVYMTLQLN